MPIYLSKKSRFANNSPISFIFNFWSRVASPWLNVKAQENRKIYLWGKLYFLLGLLVWVIANLSYAQNTPLTQALNLLSTYTGPIHTTQIMFNLGATLLFVSILYQALCFKLCYQSCAWCAIACEQALFFGKGWKSGQVCEEFFI